MFVSATTAVNVVQFQDVPLTFADDDDRVVRYHFAAERAVFPPAVKRLFATAALVLNIRGFGHGLHLVTARRAVSKRLFQLLATLHAEGCTNTFGDQDGGGYGRRNPCTGPRRVVGAIDFPGHWCLLA